MAIADDVATLEGQWPWVSDGTSRTSTLESQVAALTNRVATVEGGSSRISDLIRSLNDVETSNLPVLANTVGNVKQQLADLKTWFDQAVDGQRQRLQALADKLG